MKDWVLIWTEHFATFCDVAECSKTFVSVLSSYLGVGTQHGKRHRKPLKRLGIEVTLYRKNVEFRMEICSFPMGFAKTGLSRGLS